MMNRRQAMIAAVGGAALATARPVGVVARDSIAVDRSPTMVSHPKATMAMIANFSRNPANFPLCRYVEHKRVADNLGHYLGSCNLGSTPDDPDMAYRPFETKRYQERFRTDRRELDGESWASSSRDANAVGTKAMIRRTVMAHLVLEDEKNWNRENSASVCSEGEPDPIFSGRTLPPGPSGWASASKDRPLLMTGFNAVGKALSDRKIDRNSLVAVFNPNTASDLCNMEEIQQFLVQTQYATTRLVGLDLEVAEKTLNYGLPPFFRGIRLIVEDTAIDRGSDGVFRPEYACAEDTIYFLSVPTRGMAEVAESPEDSRIRQEFKPVRAALAMLCREDMTVESGTEGPDGLAEVRLTSDFDFQMTRPRAAFRLQNVFGRSEL